MNFNTPEAIAATKAEVQRVAAALAVEYSNTKREFARTVVTDLGSWWRRNGKLYVNQCGLLCVWWTCAIQRELGQCTKPVPGVSDRIFGTVADLYTDLNTHLAEYSVEKRKVCRDSKHRTEGCSACTHSFTEEGNLNRDYFAVLANMTGRVIYMWDMYDGVCYKYSPCDANGRTIDVEAVDPMRTIMICGLHGHYELLCGMFRMQGGSYAHVDAAMSKIMSATLFDRQGESVSVNPPVLSHNLGPVGLSAKSFIKFPCGTLEPIINRTNVECERDAEIAKQLHNELNPENKM